MKMKIVVTLKSGKTVELSKEEYEELQKEGIKSSESKYRPLLPLKISFLNRPQPRLPVPQSKCN